MLAWFKSLGTVWKIVIGVAILILAFVVYDMITGGISDVKSWWFNKNYEATMQKNEELSKANDALRAQNIELEKKIVADDAKITILQGQDKDLTAKKQAELDKLNQALQQQDAEEATTAQEIDNYTRCQRTKEKMQALGIKSAGSVNCEQYKQ